MIGEDHVKNFDVEGHDIIEVVKMVQMVRNETFQFVKLEVIRFLDHTVIQFDRVLTLKQINLL